MASKERQVVQVISTDWMQENGIRASCGAKFSRGGAKFGRKKSNMVQLSSYEEFPPLNTMNSHNSVHIKIPVGDGPYVRAKQVQLLEKDPDRAIALFWAAINAHDRVDSALKDMAIVMKQQNRAEEAIQAVHSFRHLCSDQAQESLDNVLLDLYKKCGRLDNQIELLKHKLVLIHKGMVFNGKRTKTARSQGKKFQISIRQEATRLLGNLGWAYMQLSNYVAAEAVYRKALSIEEDNNKLCNLGVCLVKQQRWQEAKVVLTAVAPVSPDGRLNSESHIKSFERAQALLKEIEASNPSDNSTISSNIINNNIINNNNHNHQNSTNNNNNAENEFDLWTHPTFWDAGFVQLLRSDPAANSVNPDTNSDNHKSDEDQISPSFSRKITNDQYNFEHKQDIIYSSANISKGLTTDHGHEMISAANLRRSLNNEHNPELINSSANLRRSSIDSAASFSCRKLVEDQNVFDHSHNITSTKFSRSKFSTDHQISRKLTNDQGFNDQETRASSFTANLHRSISDNIVHSTSPPTTTPWSGVWSPPNAPLSPPPAAFRREVGPVPATTVRRADTADGDVRHRHQVDHVQLEDRRVARSASSNKRISSCMYLSLHSHERDKNNNDNNTELQQHNDLHSGLTSLDAETAYRRQHHNHRDCDVLNGNFSSDDSGPAQYHNLSSSPIAHQLQKKIRNDVTEISYTHLINCYDNINHTIAAGDSNAEINADFSCVDRVIQSIVPDADVDNCIR